MESKIQTLRNSFRFRFKFIQGKWNANKMGTFFVRYCRTYNSSSTIFNKIVIATVQIIKALL